MINFQKVSSPSHLSVLLIILNPTHNLSINWFKYQISRYIGVYRVGNYYLAYPIATLE